MSRQKINTGINALSHDIQVIQTDEEWEKANAEMLKNERKGIDKKWFDSIKAAADAVFPGYNEELYAKGVAGDPEGMPAFDARNVQILLAELWNMLQAKRISVAIRVAFQLGCHFKIMQVRHAEALAVAGQSVRQGAEKSRRKRLGPIQKRDAEICKKMKERILKRGSHKQPSNEKIRKDLAGEYQLGIRRIRTITAEFNQKK